MLKVQFFNSFALHNNTIIHQKIYIVFMSNLLAPVNYTEIILPLIGHLLFVQQYLQGILVYVLIQEWSQIVVYLH